MDIILYNPLSSKGKNKFKAEKLSKKLRKKGHQVDVIDLITIQDVKAFLSPYQATDRIIIIGGDGTLHRIVNQINNIKVIPEVWMLRAGTGNDFIRSIPEKGKLVPIKKYLKDLPTLKVNGESIQTLNCAGIGLDGMICHKVNESKRTKDASNYFKHTAESFMKFKPVSATITVDGKTWHEDKLWFASGMFASFFGGGMRIAPKKKRDQHEIELVLVRNIHKFMLLLIFPTIYIGWHTMFKRWVSFYRGTDIKVVLDEPSYMQVDGEDIYPVTQYEMTFK